MSVMFVNELQVTNIQKLYGMSDQNAVFKEYPFLPYGSHNIYNRDTHPYF